MRWERSAVRPNTKSRPHSGSHRTGTSEAKYAPRDVLLPSQFYDRTSARAAHTFFGEGIAAHIAFAEPISTKLRNLLAESARSLGVTVHNGGTYVNMDGPGF